MSASPRVSVVLPVHNMAVKVERAVSALLAQTYDDFELTVCDDGSDDGTLGVLERIADHDSRVSIVTAGHGGVSSARNHCLDMISGDYVAFVDGDDLPHADLLETLVKGIEGVDLSVAGYRVMSGSSGLPLYDTLSTPCDGWREYSSSRFMEMLFSNELMYQGYVWNKLFRRELLEEGESLRFQQGLTCNEDRYFVFEYLRRAMSVRYCGLPRYDYFSSPRVGSYDPSWATEIVAFDKMIDQLRWDVPSSSAALRYAEKDCFRGCVDLLYEAAKRYDPDTLWLREYVWKLSSHANEFGDYPKEFRDKIKWALSFSRPLSDDARDPLRLKVKG